MNRDFYRQARGVLLRIKENIKSAMIYVGDNFEVRMYVEDTAESVDRVIRMVDKEDFEGMNIGIVCFCGNELLGLVKRNKEDNGDYLEIETCKCCVERIYNEGYVDGKNDSRYGYNIGYKVGYVDADRDTTNYFKNKKR